MTKPLTVTREEAFQHIRDTLVTDDHLVRRAHNPFNAAGPNKGKPTNELLSQSGNLASSILDRIFTDGATQMTRGEYRQRVVTFARSPEAQEELRYTFRTRMSATPFDATIFSSELAKAATKALRTHARLIRAAEKIEAEPAVVAKPVASKRAVEPEIETPTPLTAARVEETITAFFSKQPELWQEHRGNGKVWAVLAGDRTYKLSNAVMKVLEREDNRSWEERLNTAEISKPLVFEALKQYINNHCDAFSRQMYDSTGAGLDGTRVAEKFANELCQHLASSMEVEHVSAAAADPKAPGTKALADKLAVKDGPAKGKSAA